MPTAVVAVARHAAAAAARAVDAAAAPRITRVDDLLERGGLRSQWLRHAELTCGVRGRDAQLDHQVAAVQHQERDLLALPHQSRQQHPCL